jgi:hypothetical protein
MQSARHIHALQIMTNIKIGVLDLGTETLLIVLKS